jgi:hypothetical protein
MRASPPSRLKLLARTDADLEVVSTYVQDMVLKIGDMAQLSEKRRFVLLGNRYCWEVPDQKLRVRTAIQIANVQSLQIKNINQHYAGGIASILAMKFEPKDTPKDTLEGNLRIIFSGGGEIRLAVEACEAILEDISDAWAAQSRPSHEFD